MSRSGGMFEQEAVNGKMLAGNFVRPKHERSHLFTVPERELGLPARRHSVPLGVVIVRRAAFANRDDDCSGC